MTWKKKSVLYIAIFDTRTELETFNRHVYVDQYLLTSRKEAWSASVSYLFQAYWIAYSQYLTALFAATNINSRRNSDSTGGNIWKSAGGDLDA